jgi:outer membrane receptor protein involved in Fe transport
MKVTKVHAAVVAALTGVSGLTYQTASAQEGLEEIVVTATRRAQNLQEVPISIVAITGEGLETRGIDNLEEVSQGIPNVLVTGGGGGTGGANFRMRGIPGVGTYIDGVWQVGSAGALTNEFVEIDRVEVLRGPQGTMFGRDSTGGAIRIWTKRPAEEFGGTISATAGSNDRFDVKASLDLPLGENVRTKWTGASLSRDGYIRSLTTGEDGGNIDQETFRGDIEWDATENLTFRLNYQDAKQEFTEPRVQDAMFRTYDDPAPTWVKSIIGLPEVYTLVGTDYRGNPVEPFFDPVNQVAGYPGGKVGLEENRSGTVLPNVYETEQVALETSWTLTDNLSLQFVTASTTQDADSVVDWDNSQYDLVLDMNRSQLDVFSQEIQLTGGRDRFEWLAGAYYWDQEIQTRNGRWQVNEFQKQLMNPNNVFAHPTCNPVGAATELTPSTTDNPNNRRFVPGTSGVIPIGAYAGQTVQLGGGPFVPDRRRSYQIASLDHGRVLEVDASTSEAEPAVRLAPWTGRANQGWKAVPLVARDAGFFEIVSTATEKCLTLAESVSGKGVVLIQADWGGVESQKWRFVLDERGELRIEAKGGGKVLTAEDGPRARDQRVVSSGDRGDPNQRWRLLPAD